MATARLAARIEGANACQTMNAHYHIQITTEALREHFRSDDLEVIVAANLSQDRLLNLMGRPEIHFDDSEFEAGLRYAEYQRSLATAAMRRGERVAALQAFGRLLHGWQDFYAHSNWVSLWMQRLGDIGPESPISVFGSDASMRRVPICVEPLLVPQLISGTTSVLRYLVYRTPLLGRLMKRCYLPPDSHEAMNLDHPGQGPLFAVAVTTAIDHTRHEFAVLLERLAGEASPQAVTLFLHLLPPAT